MRGEATVTGATTISYQVPLIAVVTREGDLVKLMVNHPERGEIDITAALIRLMNAGVWAVG